MTDVIEARLDNLEKQLFQFASKGHRTLYRQTEEAAPLAKLEATVRLLDSEFQQFRGTDPKRLIDALVTQHNANFREEIEQRLATRASEEELLQFTKDIHRIETFTRETQVNVFSLKSKLESLGADLESRFTEKRWSALESNFAKAAAKQQEDLQKEIRGQQRAQEEQVETKLKGVQSLLTLLEKEVRTQYGPEMLQEHMRTLEQSLAATVRSSLTDATNQLTSKVANYESQTQSLRQLVLEAVADMKQELQGAALQARFQAYEDRLAEQEERYKTLGQQYSQLEAHLKRQTQAAQERQSDLYQELEQTQAHIKELDVKAIQAQQQVVTTCAKWLKDREQTFDARYGQTEAIISSLQGRALALEEELGIALEQRKRYETQWKEEQAALQKSFEEKFTAWTDDKTVYLTGRVVDLTQQLQSTINLTKLHQRRVDELLAEENIRGFVSAIETKVRTTVDEWTHRRNTEFSLKFTGFDKQYEEQKKNLEQYKESIYQEKEALLRKIRNIYKEEVDTSVLHFNTKVTARIATIQSEIQSEIQKFEQAKAEIHTLRDMYDQQVNSAMVVERYAEFQESLKKEIRSTFTANQNALTVKYAESMEDLKTMLQIVKEQSARIETTFSEKALRKQLQIVETGVLKASEDWRTRTQSALTYELHNLQEQREKLNTLFSEKILDDHIQRMETKVLKATEEWRIRIQAQLPSLYTITNNANYSTESIVKHAQTGPSSIYHSLTKCFYTAVFGTPGQRLDTLGLMKPPPGWDAFCFTNQPDLQANGWQLIQMPIEKGSPILQAKYVKWNSHTLLEDYDVAIWLDAHLAPNLSSRNLLEEWIPQAYQAKVAVIHRPHDVRNCVWDECKAVVDAKRDTPEHIESLKRRLTSSKMPKGFGLFDTNMMIRFHKLKTCQTISETIWNALTIDTHRDQLVVTPIYFTTGFKSYKVLPLQQAFDRSGTHVRISAV